MRLIDADAFVEYIEEDIEQNLCLCDEEDDDYDKLCTAISIARGFIKQIEKRPSVEAKPVVHGEWIRQKNSIGSWTHPTYRCSICGSGTNNDTKYCSECGASMEKWNYSKSKWE